MRLRFRINRSLLAILLLIGSAAPMTGRDDEQPFTVAVFTNNTGVVSPSGKRLYATVSEIGRLTYTDTGKTHLMERSRKLAQRELQKLRSALENPDFLKLNGVVAGPPFQPYDYQTVVEITVTRGYETQHIVLVDFDSTAGRDFPPGAKEFLCVLDEIRNSHYRLSKCKAD